MCSLEREESSITVLSVGSCLQGDQVSTPRTDSPDLIEDEGGRDFPFLQVKADCATVVVDHEILVGWSWWYVLKKMKYDGIKYQNALDRQDE